MSTIGSAQRLLGEFSRGDEISTYNAKVVSDIITETELLASDLENTFMRLNSSGNMNENNDKKVSGSLTVYKACISRNKRCLLAYHSKRADLIDSARWNMGHIIPDSLKSKLSTEENDYYKSYSKLLAKYMERENVDITRDLYPPKFDKIMVRALQDCGVIALGRGSRVVNSGDIILMARADAEHFIHRNMMQEVSWEI